MRTSSSYDSLPAYLTRFRPTSFRTFCGVQKLQKVFKSQGLEKFGASGEKFDPHLHDAMFEYEDPCKEPGTLGQVRCPSIV